MQQPRLWNLVDARLRAECDLQLTWFEPMQVMSSSGACRVYDIAEELSITVGGTSKLVDCIEAAGLCRRRSNPQDRRSSIIELTPAGRRLLARADAVFEDELQRRLGSSISAAALVRLGSTLRDLRSAINQPPEPSGRRAARDRRAGAVSDYPRSKSMTNSTDDVDPTVAPSGTGCVECLNGASPGWWLHLRRCAACGHVGCCDNSPSQHATAHYRATGHPVLRSFEPGEDWFYDFRSGDFLAGPMLAPPDSHPADQPVPGPAGAVPADWQRHLN